jgi:hypothetical protein
MKAKWRARYRPRRRPRVRVRRRRPRRHVRRRRPMCRRPWVLARPESRPQAPAKCGSPRRRHQGEARVTGRSARGRLSGDRSRRLHPPRHPFRPTLRSSRHLRCRECRRQGACRALLRLPRQAGGLKSSPSRRPRHRSAPQGRQGSVPSPPFRRPMVSRAGLQMHLAICRCRLKNSVAAFARVAVGAAGWPPGPLRL